MRKSTMSYASMCVLSSSAICCLLALVLSGHAIESDQEYAGANGSTIPMGFDQAYPLYPYANEYHKGMYSIKIQLDAGTPTSKVKSVNEVLDSLRELDHITRGIPKLAVLVGFQLGGHDHQYPMWGPANPKLKRPEDVSAEMSLVYLMKTAASQYHTQCTVHVNMIDGYEGTNLWNTYIKNKCICRNKDGSLRRAWFDKANNRQAYAINIKKAWDLGMTRELMDGLISMLPGIRESKAIYTDANRHFYEDAIDGTSIEDQIVAYKKSIRYMKSKYGIDCIGEFGADKVPALYGYIPIGLTWDLGSRNPMQLPPYLFCGGNANVGNTQERMIFGCSVQLEYDKGYVDDPITGFSLYTLPFVFLNNKLRVSYNAAEKSAEFSDGVKSYIDGNNGTLMITQYGKNLRVGDDVFIPETWKSGYEIMAFSKNGYQERAWDLPNGWETVSAIDIYNVTKNGPALVHRAVPVIGHRVQLTLEPKQAQIIVDAHTDINANLPLASGGKASFIRSDLETHGNWIGKYGSDGYDIVGMAPQLPAYAAISYMGTNDVIWNDATSDVRALQRPGSAMNRIAASKQSALHFIVDVNLKIEPQVAKTVSLYLLDWDNANAGRQSLVEVLDGNTGAVLDCRIISNYQNGKYVTYNVEGHVQFRLTKLLKENMVEVGQPAFSAIFFH